MIINNHPVRIINDNYIYLEDSGVPPTITNQAEEIIAALGNRIGKRKVYYRDTTGCIDELVVKDGAFYHFANVPLEKQIELFEKIMHIRRIVEGLDVGDDYILSDDELTVWVP